MSTAVVDCKMAKILLKKFGYLEKRVTYLEGKSRGQENLIQKLKIKLKKLKLRNRNRNQVGQSSLEENCEEPGVGESSQEEFEDTIVDVKPNLIELTGSTQKAHLDILKPDKKLSQKLVVKLGIRCSGKIQEIVNSSSEKGVERDRRSRISQNQSKIKRTLQNTKTGGKSSRPKGGKRAHICAFCSKSWKCFEDLSQHMRIHTGERPYKCQICSISFITMGHLKRHGYLHTGEKPYSCSVCSKTFAYTSTLKCHMNKHSGEKPYSCSVCSKTFATPSGLYYHMAMHKGTYSCSICSIKIGSKSNLKIHERIHTGERPHECTKCNKKFTQVGNLVCHKKKNLNCQQE